MEPIFVSDIQLYQEKILGRKWKCFVAVFYEENQLGKSRIELYQSQQKFRILDVSKIILLENCISLKAGKTETGISFIKLNFRDETSIQISSEELLKITEVISTICFPKKVYSLQCVTIAPSTSLESPTDDGDFFDFPESYPVLRLQSIPGRHRTMGFYSLILGECFQINGPNDAHCFPYSSIIWVAAGELCFGIEVDNEGIFEFATGDPLLIVEHLSCNFSPPKQKTICRFNRYFHPIRPECSPIASNNSTMESVDSGGVFTKVDSNIPTSPDTSISSLLNPEQDYIHRVVKNELRRNASTEMLRNKISFLQKIKSENRADFEENANTDFVRLQVPKMILAEQIRFPSSKNVSFQEAEMKIALPRQTDL
ncbi:unnamed protein product [Caenorhabditis bovis]|uniref:PH domain-containing protein n=1 Tax=Caenorhabditis bovis TaxID=2654633 RepID=A0A8S1F383_9PELO|nr:unnamed protein product [Caenorhabditis bovis]